ncbi:MAG: ribonuclease III, partial [Candidatus Dormibacteria bacterium]
MTHTSWINERGVAGRDNERLEYLGDAVLELVAGEYLFKRFPGYDEGQLTQIRSSLVSTVALARLGEELRLGETLRLGKGAAKSGARRLTSLHANAFEALVGATFLDQGYRRAGRIFLSRIGDLSAWTDPNFKGRLQAVAQEKLGGPPQYRTAPVGQDARSRQYLSQVSVEGHGTLGEGRGGTKQAAEQAAARLALEKLMAPAPKRRRGRSAVSPAVETVSTTTEPTPSPPALAALPAAGDEAGQPRRKRRRSRSRSAVELLSPEVSAVEPSGLEPSRV